MIDKSWMKPLQLKGHVIRETTEKGPPHPMLTKETPQLFPNESNTIEYKEVCTEKIKKEIAAFLNGDDVGYIYLGVDDQTRTLVRDFSAQERHQIEETISRWVSSSLYYPSPIGLVHVLTNASILTIEVRPGENKPYALDERVYQRNNSESVKASPETVNKMLRNQSLDTYDKSPAVEQDLTFAYLKELFHRLHVPYRPEALGFYTGPEHTYTNTAFLLSDQNTNVVKIAVFEGNTVMQFKDRKEITGPLPKQLEDALSYTALVNPVASTITGKARREDRQAYPQVAIREGIINALTHRSYFSKSPVQVEVFDDRMTIMSPGPLPGGLDEEAILHGQTLPRNPNVVTILHRLDFIENYGTGIRRIFEAYEGQLKQPHILAREDFVKLTLPNLNYESTTAIAVSEQSDGVQGVTKAGDVPGTEWSDQVSGYLRVHGSMTRQDVETLLDIKTSQATKYLRQMAEQGVLTKVGAGPATRYQLAEKAK